MIQEAYVSYETAQLLKKKGFDVPCNSWYIPYSDGSVKKCILAESVNYNHYDDFPWTVSCPTHQMACAWLREKHNILITIIPQEVKVGIDKLCYAIYRITEDVYTPLYNGFINNLVDSYEDAVEAALKYTLNNLL